MRYLQVLFFLSISFFFTSSAFALSQAPTGSDFYYVADIEQCKVIKYRCEDGWEYYSDSAGCGCQKTEKPKVCTMEYTPVCGETPAKVCMSLDCAQHEKTYSNRCSLDSESATFLYEWECTQKSELPAKTATKYYVGDTQKCQRIMYKCEDSWEYFGDTLGCGCQKELSQKVQKSLGETMSLFFERLEKKNYEREQVLSVLQKVTQRLQELSKQEKYSQFINYISKILDTYQSSL